MDSTGPDRRSRRRRSAKPYERPPPQRQSPLTSLWSIITAPFKKAATPDPPVSESGSESDDESPQVVSDRDVAQNARMNRMPKHVPSLAARNLSKRGHEMQASQSSTQLYPRMPSPFHFPESGTSAASSSSAFLPVPARPTSVQPLAFDSTAAPETNLSRTPSSSGIRFGPSRAETPDAEQRNSIYQPIVDFLQRKGDEKLNDFEVIGLTQTLKKTSHSNAQDLVDILEASENVPSASFLQNLRSNAQSSPAKRPFLAPPPPLNLPSSTTPPRRRNRRASYVGVGQNSPRIASPARRLSIRDTETSPDTSSSGKKRRLGDFGAPAHTNAAAGSSNISEEPSASKMSPPRESQSSVPFPASSPTPSVDKAGPVVSVHPSRFARHNAFKTQPSSIPSPLRNVASFQSEGSSPKLQPRKSDLSSRSQASTVILDILNDGSDAPPLPPPPAPELTNPFEKPSLIRPRVSVPTPRKVSKPLSRPGLSPAPLAPAGSNSKRGFDSDHILDQIASTAPKRAKTETKPVNGSQPETTTTGATQPIVPSISPPNPFGTPSPSTVIAFSLRTSAASSPSVFDDAPSKVLKPKPEIQSLLKSKPVQKSASTVDPSQSTRSGSTGPSASVIRTHAFGLGASTKPKPLNEPEIIVLDDDDDDDMDVDTTKIASVQSFVSLRPGHRRRQSIHRAEDIPIIVEDVGDSDVSPSRSRSPSPTKSAPPVRAKSVEEVEEEVDKSSKGSTNRGRSFGSRANVTLSVSNGFGPGAAFKSTSPVVPSPLRHVSLPPSDSDDDDQANRENQKPAQDPTVERHPVLKSPKTRACHLPPQDLTSFELFDPSTLTVLGSSTPKDKDMLKARSRAAALPEDKLKVYNFINAPPSSNSTALIKPFDWSEAGFKPPVSNGTWACGLCMCQSPASVEKCIVCGADRPSSMSNEQNPFATSRTGPSPPAALTNGFNWAASGMNPQSTATWTCTLCMLQSPADAVKCIVCEADRPDRPSSTLGGVQNSPPSDPPSQGGFDWAAAGMKLPPSSSGDTWTCRDCCLQSPAAAQKCIVCEAPRPL